MVNVLILYIEKFLAEKKLKIFKHYLINQEHGFNTFEFSSIRKKFNDKKC
jgi:hypothetical protein